MSRRTLELQKKVEAGKRYSIDEAVPLVKQTAKAKFDETVEIHVRLVLMPKKATKTCVAPFLFPFGTGKIEKSCGRGQRRKSERGPNRRR
jgi:large subunit ribosomal protein L1